MEGVTERYVGVDWGEAEHRVCVEDAQGQVLGKGRFGADAAGLRALREWVLSFAPDDAGGVAAGLERPGGVLVATLLAAGMRVWAINPKQLDRFRGRFSAAGAKDDDRDAWVLADSLRTDRQAYREVRPQPAAVEELRGLERLRAELQQELLRVSARLRDVLCEYFPAALELLAENQPDRFVCAVLEAAAEPGEARRKHVSTWAKLLQRCGVKRVSAEEVAELFRREAPPSLPGVAAWGVASVRALVAQWRVLDEQFRQVERRITGVLKALETPVWDNEEEAGATAQMLLVLRSMPSTGPVILSTVLGEAWDLLRARDIAGLRAQSGVAPVTRQSGKFWHVVRRRACNPRLQHAVFHWARLAAENDPVWKERYRALRARGVKHARALRTIGDRLIHVLIAMLSNGTTYEPARVGAHRPRAA